MILVMQLSSKSSLWLLGRLDQEHLDPPSSTRSLMKDDFFRSKEKKLGNLSQKAHSPCQLPSQNKVLDPIPTLKEKTYDKSIPKPYNSAIKFTIFSQTPEIVFLARELIGFL